MLPVRLKSPFSFCLLPCIALSVRPRGSGDPDLETLESLALGPRFRGDERCDCFRARHIAKTYSTSAWRWSLSSGVFSSLRRETGLGPDTMATYCLPLTSNVIGGAEKPEPILIFHSSSSVVSSYAATVPSSSARNTRPPPVASVPL